MSWKSQLFKFENPWNNIAPRLHMEGTKMFDMFNTWLLKDGSGQENMFQHATAQHVMDSTKLRTHFLFSLSVSLFCHPWNPVSDRNFNKVTNQLSHPLLKSGGNSKPPFAEPPQQWTCWHVRNVLIIEKLPSRVHVRDCTEAGWSPDIKYYRKSTLKYSKNYWNLPAISSNSSRTATIQCSLGDLLEGRNFGATK